jgi:stage III sporulation protein AH
MIINKRTIIILVVIVVAAGIGFWGLRESGREDKLPQNRIDPGIETKSESAKADSISFFAEYRMERERTRSKQIELLQEIISQNSQGKARDAASLRLVTISEDIEKEMKAENLIKSSGYRECVVIIQPRITTVVVQANALTSEQETELKNLVATAIAQEVDKISIIVRK